MHIIVPTELRGEHAAGKWLSLGTQWHERRLVIDPKTGVYADRDGHDRNEDTTPEGKAGEYLIESVLNENGLPYAGADIVRQRGTFEHFDLTASGYLPIEVKVTHKSLVYCCTPRDPKFLPGDHHPHRAGIFVGLLYDACADTLQVEIVCQMRVIANEAPEPCVNYGTGLLMPGKRRLNALHIALNHRDALISDLSAFRGDYVQPTTRSYLFTEMTRRLRRWERQSSC